MYNNNGSFCPILSAFSCSVKGYGFFDLSMHWLPVCKAVVNARGRKGFALRGRSLFCFRMRKTSLNFD